VFAALNVEREDYNYSPKSNKPLVAMPELTEQLWNTLWQQQQKREAEAREKLRLAIAAASSPLPQELVDKLVMFSDSDFGAAMREHPAYTLSERRDSYEISLSIMEMSIADLLAAISDFEQRALPGESALFQLHGRGELDKIEDRIQKELFAVANAAASLVDHSRRLQKRFEFEGYSERLAADFGEDGLHSFVIAIRILLHHLRILQAGWSIQSSFKEGTKTATFNVSKETLQRVIAQHPERFENDALLVAYVNAAPDKIDLRKTFEEYRRRMRLFNGWLKEQLASDSLVTLRDYDHVMLERKRHGSRTWWGVLLGNWIHNWKVPPNPHNHLPKYLTPEQLKAVYALPRNSKEQVDLAISYVDVNGAITPGLREEAYELFRRSPPEAAAAE
jgi:hypothetical protein